MRAVTFGSVCSGIEAASVAWHPLGWRAAWLAEIEPFPSAVLAHHYPDVPNLGDMTKLAAMIRAGEIEAPDVFCGGTPCQAFSVAGLRRSLDDARGNLSLTFCEIANELDAARSADGREPVTVFWENVPGVLSTKDNAFGCFLAGLAGEDDPLQPPGGKWSNAGAVYGPRRAVAWRVLDAQYFGVAQRRRRVFVVASSRAGFDPAAVLFEFDGVRRDTAPRREAGEEAAAGTLRSTDGDCDVDHGRAGHLRPVAFGGNNQSGPIDVATARNACSSSSGRLDFESETFLVQPVPFDTTQITSATNRSKPEPGHPCHPLAAGAHPPASAFSCKDYGADACLDLAPTLRAMNHADSHANGGGQMAVAFDSRQDPVSSQHVSGSLGSSSPQAQAVAYSTKLHNTGSNNAGKLFEERTTCLDANSPPPALLTAKQVRRLTPTEAERLMGFPDGYTAIPWRGKPADQCPDGPRYRSLGNSWAVPVAKWIGQRIDKALSLDQTGRARDEAIRTRSIRASDEQNRALLGS